MVYGAIGWGVAVGKFAGTAGVVALVVAAVGALVTVITTVIAMPDFGVAVLVERALTAGVVGLGATAVSQLVNKTRQKNNPAMR